MYIKLCVKIAVLLCVSSIVHAQYVPHHTVSELTIDGSFEDGQGHDGYQVWANSCYKAFHGECFQQAYSSGRIFVVLKQDLSSEVVYNLSFRMRLGNKQYMNPDDGEGFQCDKGFPCKGKFSLYLAENMDGSGNRQSLGVFDDLPRTYWKLVDKTVKPNRSTYDYIIFELDGNGWYCENHVAIDAVSLQECGVQNCSRTAGKINKPNIACSSCTPTIDNNSILEITNNLDNVSRLTVEYGGSTKIDIQNPNGIQRFATNGSEFGFSGGGEYTLKFTLQNGCDEIEFTQKILFSCVNTSINMSGKNNNRPGDPDIPRYMCADYVTVTSVYMPQDDLFGARKVLSTSGSVTSDNPHTFAAGERVVLNQGFVASDGFVAEIRDPGTGLKSDILYDEAAIEEAIADNLELIEPEVEQEEVLVEDLPVEIVLSPNPTRGILRINLSRAVDFEFEVCSKSGSSLLKERNPETVDLSSFPSDLYYVKIKIGDIVTMKKVIKL